MNRCVTAAAAACLVLWTLGCSDSTEPTDGADVAVTVDWSESGFNLTDWQLEEYGCASDLVFGGETCAWSRCDGGSMPSGETFSIEAYCECDKDMRLKLYHTPESGFAGPQYECHITVDLGCYSGIRSDIVVDSETYCRCPVRTCS